MDFSVFGAGRFVLFGGEVYLWGVSFVRDLLIGWWGEYVFVVFVGYQFQVVEDEGCFFCEKFRGVFRFLIVRLRYV